MPGYRFCRTDDVPLLVEAVNLCRGPESAGEPPLTIDGYRTLVREIDLWASSCMLAMEGSVPIGVMLACKRHRATLIHTLHVRPTHRRQGHGRHMLQSLGSKLAILGPPLMVAEVPAGRSDLRGFLEARGFRAESAFADLACDSPPAPPDLPDLSFPVTVEDLRQAGVLAAGPSDPWERAPETLAARAPALEGIGLGTDAAIEAWLLWRRAGETREVAAFGCGAGEQGRALLAILMARFVARERGPVVVLRVPAQEWDAPWVAAGGFRKSAERIRCTAHAAPA